MKKLSFIALASVTVVSFSFTAFAEEKMSTKRMRGGHNMMHKLMDTDGDGSVSTQEFQAYQNQIFSDTDKNGDGSIDAKEFAEFSRIMKEQRKQAMEQAKQERAQKYFTKLDADGDGKISKAEFDAKGKRRFIRMDRNDDGVLNKDDRSRQRHQMKKNHKRDGRN